jgi:hypothetical protein
MGELWGIIDLLRNGYYDSDEAVRVAMRNRRLPKHFKIGNKVRWQRKTIEDWFRNGSIMWIERSNKP